MPGTGTGTGMSYLSRKDHMSWDLFL
jgi:hypothetical protein